MAWILSDMKSLLETLRQAYSEGDTRIVPGETELDAQERALAGDPHVNRMPQAMLGHLGARKLEQLGRLLEHVIAGLGTFP